MKLVDILATDLKVWPKNVYAITQDDDGKLIGSLLEDPPILKDTAWGGGAFYLDDPVDSYECFVLKKADDYQSAIVTNEQWLGAVNAQEADSSPAWAGEGLPPVGTVCRLSHNGSDQGVVTVNYITPEFCVCKSHDFGHEQGATTEHYTFTRIRTPEQIAAEEREAGITQMRELVGSLNTHPFAELWDACYRLQAKP